MMLDGHLNHCKECKREQACQHRNNNLEKIREYDRARGNRQPVGYLKEYRGRYPKVYKAHGMVNRALRAGKIVKGICECCDNPKTVAHHDDYDKPLEVRWLCQGCHKQWHAENGPGLNRDE